MRSITATSSKRHAFSETTLLTFVPFLVFSILLAALARNADLGYARYGFIAINFTVMIFSLNFTFLGQNISPYRDIWSKVSDSLWLSMAATLVLPFLSLCSMFSDPQSLFYNASLFSIPLMVYLGVLNYRIASAALSPLFVTEELFSDKSVAFYLKRLEIEVRRNNKEVEEAREGHIRNMPMNLFGRSPRSASGEIDFFGKFIHIVELSIKNKDLQTYSAVIDEYLRRYDLLLASDSPDSSIRSGLQAVAHKQFSLLVRVIVGSSGDHYFPEYFADKLYVILLDEGVRRGGFDPKINSMCTAIEVMANASFDGKIDIDIRKLLHTLHLFLLKVFNDLSGKDNKSLDLYNFSVFIDVVKRIGMKSITCGQVSVLYSAMESITYLGCHFAKNKSEQSVLACLNALVQLGRASRHHGLQCFWSRCLQPPHMHAEENIGHIMTWAYSHQEVDGFFLQGGFEVAYSRIRGYEVGIEPDPKFNPVFWLKEAKDDGDKVAWIESVSGMYGYYSELDYSDFGNLKEHELNKYRSRNTMHSAPVSYEFEDDEDKEEGTHESA